MKPSVAFHENLAQSWDSKYSRRSFRTRIEAVQQMLGEQTLAGQRWLDAGCGTGTLARLLAERGAAVVGVDASPAMIGQAKELMGSLAERLAFEVVGGIERLPFVDHDFDGVLCSSVLEYAQDPACCVAELHRVLRPGGLLVVSVPNRRSLLRVAQRLCFQLSKRVLRSPVPRYLSYSRHEFSAREFGEFLQRQGFAVRRRSFCGSPLGGQLGRLSWVGSLLFAAAEKRGR